MERAETDRLEVVEAEVAVLRQLVWRLITRVPGGADDARTTMRLMLMDSRRYSAATAVNAVEMLSRLPVNERSIPSPAELPADTRPRDMLQRDPLPLASEVWSAERRAYKTCPDCGPDMLITVLIEEGGPHLPHGGRRHLLRCMGCRHEESHIFDSPGG